MARKSSGIGRREPAEKRHDVPPVKPPSAGALVWGLIPFVAMCFTVALWDRVEPTVLGIPFNMAWLIGWIPLSTLCLWAAYRRERK